MATVGTCISCRFFYQKHSGGHSGECRRYPAQTISPILRGGARAERPEHYFPVVLTEHWCGEFSAAAE